MQEHRPPQDQDQGKARERGEKPVSFDHDRLARTPEESQKRLFASRRRKAKQQRRSERRSKRLRTVIFPVIIVTAIVALLVATVWNWHRANKEAEEKLARDAELREERMRTGSAARAAPTEVEAALDRYLQRDASLPEGRQEASKE